MCWFLIIVCPILSDKMESNANNSLKYVPGKARSHHLQMMMSKDELEEEQRSVTTREQLPDKTRYIKGLLIRINNNIVQLV